MAETARMDYFPLVKGTYWVYVLVDYDAALTAVQRVVLKVESVRTENGTRIATISRQEDADAPVTLTMRKDAMGVWFDRNLEVKFSLEKGADWRVDDDRHYDRNVIATAVDVRTISETFTGCLQVDSENFPIDRIR